MPDKSLLLSIAALIATWETVRWFLRSYYYRMHDCVLKYGHDPEKWIVEPDVMFIFITVMIIDTIYLLACVIALIGSIFDSSMTNLGILMASLILLSFGKAALSKHFSYSTVFHIDYIATMLLVVTWSALL